MPGQDLTSFLEELRAPTGAPGGGAAAAIAGALGCALFQMVARITLSLPRFTEGRDELKRAEETARELCDHLQALAAEDTEAYRRVEAALKMPKETPDEKAKRREAMQEALAWATRTPLSTARASVSAMALIPDLVEYGNPNAATDVAVGALLLEAARKGASMNAEINLKSLKDEGLKASASAEMAEMSRAAEEYLRKLGEWLKAQGLSF